MPNAPEPDRGGTPNRPGSDPHESRNDPGAERAAEPGEDETEGYPLVPDDAETETVVINKPEPAGDPEPNPEGQQRERRFTAPGFDAKETAVIATTPEPATEAFATPQAPPGPPPPPAGMPPKSAVPQSIPPRDGEKSRISRQFNWGWVLALVVIVLALAAIAILGTVLLTRGKHMKVSQEDQVRHTIQQFDVAVQRGDLTALRSITCGTTRDGYVDYDEHSWAETYQRVSAAKQYPVIASIDQVVVNGQHAEANVTTFMAYDPQVRSTRSLDLQYRDDQWKICQSPSG
ncbi:hypothetical protein OQ968_22550 [Mycobacterium sp. 663a-19]|uniref:Rv0361 family membrane protein n=1 Tax=Mycobacterium sp. 663a-19 TaxID=2986148 RepID=UPI002D1E8B9A|nr:hypothetical protein [Mycobacterium sp. 663a-19]MEB3984032.1 hypothetical protein [Mycobacterium sp. 663a-19]